jgi:hypothetical protein
MLWDVEETGNMIQGVAYSDPLVTAERNIFMAIEGSYTGPYSGPATVRSFIVVHEGHRSAYCL